MTEPLRPIIYVRGYAGTQSEVEDTVDDPFYGFNIGSTHIRVDHEGKAEFFAFESPFVRLITDHQYLDVFDGSLQKVGECKTPKQTIWIYRFYDPTSKTFDRPGGRRLSIEEAADGLREFIDDVLAETKADKIYLLAHSMGGLVCRSLIQKVYPEKGLHASTFVDKFFTYGSPHGGIHFELGAGVIERVRDLLGVNNADDFGRKRMYQYLTPGKGPKDDPPASFEQKVMPAEAFDVDRVFCIVGTNAHDYEVARGLSRSLVGPQSDGLVQMEHAYVKGCHRAFIHRSHSGRYGMVNSEEGYQNLQRFLFGDVKVKTVLCDFELNFESGDRGEVSYQIETEVAIRGLPVLMHERSQTRFSAVSLNQEQFLEQKAKGGLPLFTSFLMSRNSRNGTMRYMVRLAVFEQRFRRRFLVFGEHIERLPLWSDHLVIELRARPAGSDPKYDAFYSWASENREPETKMDLKVISPARKDASIPVPARAQAVLGNSAKIRFEASGWNE